MATTLSISGDTPLAVDFSGIEWHGTLRRSADNAPIPSGWVSAVEQGSYYRNASSVTDADGTFSLIVLPGLRYDFQVTLPGFYSTYTVPNVSSVADSTFDLLVPAAIP